MTIAAFTRCLDFIWRPENDGQPYHDTPGDDGGATAWGVTLASWRAFQGDDTLQPSDLAAVARDDFRPFYAAEYWNKLRLDDVPDGLDLMTFNLGMMAGAARGAKVLQAVAGVAPDGFVGPETLRAIARKPDGWAIATYCDKALAFYRSCRGWPEFGRGWTNRLDRCVAISQQMAGGH